MNNPFDDVNPPDEETRMTREAFVGKYAAVEMNFAGHEEEVAETLQFEKDLDALMAAEKVTAEDAGIEWAIRQFCDRDGSDGMKVMADEILAFAKSESVTALQQKKGKS